MCYNRCYGNGFWALRYSISVYVFTTLDFSVILVSQKTRGFITIQAYLIKQNDVGTHRNQSAVHPVQLPAAFGTSGPRTASPTGQLNEALYISVHWLLVYSRKTQIE